MEELNEFNSSKRTNGSLSVLNKYNNNNCNIKDYYVDINNTVLLNSNYTIIEVFNELKINNNNDNDDEDEDINDED